MAIAAVTLAGVTAAGIGLYNWYGYLTSHEETDDAYTTAHMHPISSRINDTVEQVMVDDNQHVKAGDA